MAFEGGYPVGKCAGGELRGEDIGRGELMRRRFCSLGEGLYICRLVVDEKHPKVSVSEGL